MMSGISRRDFFKLGGAVAASAALLNFDGMERAMAAREVKVSGKSKEILEQVYNPYLPLNVYIPDGEPHVWGDRVYIYGSHDKTAGKVYCEDNYEVWSAPVDNLRDWRCEGTSYMRNQDPTNPNDEFQLWAPDVTRGRDGRYYIYYCFNFYPEIGVAVSDKPAGPFKFYGHVKYPARIKGGKTLTEYCPFDPAVFTDDDGRTYLYYGFAPAEEKEMEITPEMVKDLPQDYQDRLLAIKFSQYSMVAELEPDMITLKEEPREMVPGGHHTAGTGFEGHGYFEAPSMRKIRGKYYFVYSSHKSHELCYATSNYPDREFKFGGIIVSNGDIGLNGRTKPVYPLGNNHGGIVQVGSDFYIFYHRQTNGTEFSRQGCAEKIQIRSDGSIPQVEITSCGLNGRPLVSSGSYPAAIACHLTDPLTTSKIEYFDSEDSTMKRHVRVTEHMNHVFVTNIKNGATVGYKYFDFASVDKIQLEIRGRFKGTIEVTQKLDGAAIGKQKVSVSSGDWTIVDIPVKAASGKNALYFNFSGSGLLDMKRFIFCHS